MGGEYQLPEDVFSSPYLECGKHIASPHIKEIKCNSEEPRQEGGDICDPGAAQDRDLEWEECGLLGNIFPAREVGMR